VGVACGDAAEAARKAEAEAVAARKAEAEAEAALRALRAVSCAKGVEGG
jgi:hypothetical protein